MKHLYDDREVLTEEGLSYQKQVQAALGPIFAEADELGYSLRDLNNIVRDAMGLVVARRVTARRMKAEHVQGS